MAVAVSFALIFGIPFALGVAVGTIRVSWYGKLAIGASYPAVIALTLYAGQPYSLIDVGGRATSV